MNAHKPIPAVAPLRGTTGPISVAPAFGVGPTSYEAVDWLPVTWVTCGDCEGAGSFRHYRSDATYPCESCNGLGGWETNECQCGETLDDTLSCRACEVTYRAPLTAVERLGPGRIAA